MQRKQNTMMLRRVVDVCMTVLLLCLMAYQVTGEEAHEWIGMGMTVLVIVHQILNRRWYGAMFKGKYHAYRILTTVINVSLLVSFAITAFCGMAMSGYAVPFLYGMAKVSFARRVHMSMSHWAFVLMGLHLGMHIPVMAAKLKLSERMKMFFSAVLFCAAGFGLFLFIRNGMTDYLLFREQFAFLDYDKPGALVIFENILMLLFWAFVGAQAGIFCRNSQKNDKDKKNQLLPVIYIMGAVILGLVLNMVFSDESRQGFVDTGWNDSQETGSEEGGVSDPAVTNEDHRTADSSVKADPSEIQDGFVLIDGGTFLMGSPESENWRIDDEVQHDVKVSSYYIDPFETTQEEYTRLTGSDPGSFKGDRLPVENISWFDAVVFANAKSEEAGLTPAYTVTETVPGQEVF